METPVALVPAALGSGALVSRIAVLLLLDSPLTALLGVSGEGEGAQGGREHCTGGNGRLDRPAATPRCAPRRRADTVCQSVGRQQLGALPTARGAARWWQHCLPELASASLGPCLQARAPGVHVCCYWGPARRSGMHRPCCRAPLQHPERAGPLAGGAGAPKPGVPRRRGSA